MARKVYEETHIANIAEKIREKTGGDNTYNTSEMPNGIETVYEKGKQAEWSAFWDAYQDNGNRTDCANMFSGRGWNEQTFVPKFDIVCENSYMLFRYCGLVDIEKALKDNRKKIIFNNGSLQLSFNNMLTQILGEVYFNTPITSMGQTFAYSNYLQEIRSEFPVTESTTYSGVFDGCNALREVRFSGTIGKNGLNFQWSKNLSKASIENIIGCLSTTTSGLSVTLSRTSVTTAFGSTDSEEWLALINSRTNWTINLS